MARHGGGGGGGDVAELASIAVAVAVGFVAWKAGLLSSLKGLLNFSPGTKTTTGGGAGAGGPSTSTSSGSCGHTIYPATGRTTPAKDNGGQTIHYASSGQAATSRRFNANNVGYANIETTVYFVAGKGNCSAHAKCAGMTIKFWGGPHTDSSCCYCTVSISCEGQCCFGGEGPHPATSGCQQVAGNVGSVVGKLIGFKGIIWELPSGGAHQEIWVDLGGQWKKVGARNTPACGKSKTSPRPAPNAQVETRVDCTNVDIKCVSVAEIRPGSSGATTTAPQAPAAIHHTEDMFDECGMIDDELIPRITIS